MDMIMIFFVGLMVLMGILAMLEDGDDWLD